MIGAGVSAFGIFLTGLGTFVRVAPDLERKSRRWFYGNAPFIRELFVLRKEMKGSKKGRQFTVEHKRVCKEFIDYIDANDIREPPDQVPKSVTNVAAGLEIELPDGGTEMYPQGTSGQRVLIKLLTLSIERACRNYGLIIAVIGAGITIVGTVI
jgi:hypothetical protein